MQLKNLQQLKSTAAATTISVLAAFVAAAQSDRKTQTKTSIKVPSSCLLLLFFFLVNCANLYVKEQHVGKGVQCVSVDEIYSYIYELRSKVCNSFRLAGKNSISYEINQKQRARGRVRECKRDRLACLAEIG